MTDETISGKAPLAIRRVKALFWSQLGIAVLAIAAWGFVALQLKPLLNARAELQEEIKQLKIERNQLDEDIAQKQDELVGSKWKIEEANRQLETRQYTLASKTLTEAANQLPSTRLDWFTVLASYKESELDEARKHARKIAGELAGQEPRYPIEIYKTKISKNYAVTLGGRLERSKAAALAKTSRSKNWSGDAFAQVDREWTLVERYE